MKSISWSQEQIIGLVMSSEEVYGDYRMNCALMRLSRSLFGAEPWTKDLIEVAESVGFSEAKAHGIMDGWDTSTEILPAGACGLFHHSTDRDSQDYKEGLALGMQLFEQIKNKQESIK
jgi:hypothetical protein